MDQLIERTFITVDPYHIDLEKSAPLRFRRRLPGEPQESKSDIRLTGSIGRFGIIQPPLLMGSPESPSEFLLVIQGYRRIAAARASGLSSIAAMLIPDISLTREKVIALWLEGVPTGEPPSELERLYLTRKAATFAGNEWKEMLPDLLSVFGKELSPDFLQRLWKLLDLGEPTLESLHRGAVSTGDLLLISEHHLIDTDEAAGLLSHAGLNRRDQKEAVRLMIRIADNGKKEWDDFIAGYHSGNLPLLKALRAACRPTLTNDLQRIEDIVKSMHLPQGAGIHPPDSMEGGSYTLSVSIRNEEALALALKKLQDALGEGKIADLMKILKGDK